VSKRTSRSKDFSELFRYLVPLESMMTWIDFRGSGEHSVGAAVVWVKNGSVISERAARVGHHQALTKSVFERIGNGRFDWTLRFTDYDGILQRKRIEFDRDQRSTGICAEGMTSISVFVPDNHFAKKPPRWLWKFGNWWFEDEAIHQCQFRKRLMTTTLPKLIITPIWLVLTVLLRLIIAAVAAIFGLRRIEWKAVVSPFSTYFQDVGRDCEMSGWVNRMTWPFLPVVVIASAAAGFVVMRLLKSVEVMPGANFWLFGAAVFFGVLFINFLINRLIIPAVDRWVYKSIRETAEERKARRKREAEDMKRRKRREFLEAIQNDIEEHLLCESALITTDVSELPKGKRTIWLKFMDTKSKVCKPFAQ
jgi:hypothetical protein